MTIRRIGFEVCGTPAPKGSFRLGGRVRTRSGKYRPIVRKDSDRTDAWEQAVAWAARRAMEGAPPIAGPVVLEVTFWFVRPKRPANPYPPIDLDKLARSTADALSGIAYLDDRQVVRLLAEKRYAEDPGARIEVWRWEP